MAAERRAIPLLAGSVGDAVELRAHLLLPARQSRVCRAASASRDPERQVRASVAASTAERSQRGIDETAARPRSPAATDGQGWPSERGARMRALPRQSARNVLKSTNTRGQPRVPRSASSMCWSQSKYDLAAEKPSRRASDAATSAGRPAHDHEQRRAVHLPPQRFPPGQQAAEARVFQSPQRRVGKIAAQQSEGFRAVAAGGGLVLPPSAGNGDVSSQLRPRREQEAVVEIDEVDVLVIAARVVLRGGHQARAEIDAQPLEATRDRRRAAAMHPQHDHDAARRRSGGAAGAGRDRGAAMKGR